MFKKSISIAIIILCLGIIGCREVNEPIVDGTYTVVTVLEKPIDYWIEYGWTGILRWTHVDKNGKIDKIFHGNYGELTVTNNYENYICFKLDKKYYPVESVNIARDVLCSCDKMQGVYWIEGGPNMDDIGSVSFIAVRK